MGTNELALIPRRYPDARITTRGERVLRIDFPNGWGGSVIADGYGREEGLLELGITQHGSLRYGTPISPDDAVVGWLSREKLFAHLDTIQSWPSDGPPSHVTLGRGQDEH